MRVTGLAALVLVLGLAGSASAVEILKKEPSGGTLRRGQSAYVDDGKCPRGQVTMVVAQGSGQRARSCVARPN